MLAFCFTFNDRVKQGTYCKWTLEKKQDEEKDGSINWVTFQAYRENVFSNNGYQLFDHLKKEGNFMLFVLAPNIRWLSSQNKHDEHLGNRVNQKTNSVYLA